MRQRLTRARSLFRQFYARESGESLQRVPTVAPSRERPSRSRGQFRPRSLALAPARFSCAHRQDQSGGLQANTGQKERRRGFWQEAWWQDQATIDLTIDTLGREDGEYPRLSALLVLFWIPLAYFFLFSCIVSDPMRRARGMPTFAASSNQITPRSATRYRPIKGDATRSVIMRIAQRASRKRGASASPVETLDEEDIAVWRRSDEQTRTQIPPPGPRAKHAQPDAVTAAPLPSKGKKLTLPRSHRRAHPLLYLGLGMLAMLFLWTVLSLLFEWVTFLLDDLHYGRPRTFQTDAWVGHNEQTGVPSHFIALNLNRHIEIIEIPGGDAAHTHIFSGPQLYGINDDLVPVTLRFVDVNGDHRPDMIVTFSGSRLVFINDGTSFRPLLPSEQQQVEQALQHLQP